MSAYYQHAFTRSWQAPPLVIVGAGRLDEPGFSIKGGALPGELFFKIAGQQAASETPKLRAMFEQLVAHELAHVWQDLVRRGGFADDAEPWIHEGGAQALSLTALEGSGLWDAAAVATFKAKLHDECVHIRAAKADGKDADASREAYTCGYERFVAQPIGAVDLWKRMRRRGLHRARNVVDVGEFAIQDLSRHGRSPDRVTSRPWQRQAVWRVTRASLCSAKVRRTKISAPCQAGSARMSAATKARSSSNW